MEGMDVETEMSRVEAVEFFREFADKLEGLGNAADVPDDETTIIGEEDVGTTEREEATTSGTARPETMTIIARGESATVVLPERLDVEVEVGSRSGLLESGVDQHVSFDLKWEVEELPEDDSVELV